MCTIYKSQADFYFHQHRQYVHRMQEGTNIPNEVVFYLRAEFYLNLEIIILIAELNLTKQIKPAILLNK